jgi:hypothetical protein
MFLLDRTVAIYRLSQIAGNKQSYSTLTTTLQATIQPLSEAKTAMAGGSYGKMFVCFLDVDRDIVVGDKIQDRDGNIYKVISGGVENRNDGFAADYLKVTMQKIN